MNMLIGKIDRHWKFFITHGEIGAPQDIARSVFTRRLPPSPKTCLSLIGAVRGRRLWEQVVPMLAAFALRAMASNCSDSRRT